MRNGREEECEECEEWEEWEAFEEFEGSEEKRIPKDCYGDGFEI